MSKIPAKDIMPSSPSSKAKGGVFIVTHNTFVPSSSETKPRPPPPKFKPPPPPPM